MQRSKDREAIETRPDRLEHEMLRSDSLEMAAVRRLLHGLSDTESETGPVAKVDAIVERIKTLETEVTQLRVQRTHQKSTNDVPQYIDSSTERVI